MEISSFSGDALGGSLRPSGNMEVFIALLGDVGGMDYQESALGELRSGVEANIGRTRTGILPTELGWAAATGHEKRKLLPAWEQNVV